MVFWYLLRVINFIREFPDVRISREFLLSSCWLSACVSPFKNKLQRIRFLISSHTVRGTHSKDCCCNILVH